MSGRDLDRAARGQRRRGAVRARTPHRDIFGPDNFYLELQDEGMPEQREPDRAARRCWPARPASRLVATNDVHYLRHATRDAQDVLLCIGTQCHLDEPKPRCASSTEEFYLKSPARCAAFRRLPRRLRRYPRDRRALQRELALGQHPAAALPGARRAQRRRVAARRSATRPRAPLRRRAPRRGARAPGATSSSVIRDMGFAGYFLIVWDFVKLRPRARASPSVRGAARRRAASWPTRWASPTSIRSSTTCCSSAS